jgi:hypothetical protein
MPLEAAAGGVMATAGMASAVLNEKPSDTAPMARNSVAVGLIRRPPLSHPRFERMTQF